MACGVLMHVALPGEDGSPTYWTCRRSLTQRLFYNKQRENHIFRAPQSRRCCAHSQDVFASESLRRATTPLLQYGGPRTARQASTR